MSKRYPECPLANHDNCKDIDNPNQPALFTLNPTLSTLSDKGEE